MVKHVVGLIGNVKQIKLRRNDIREDELKILADSIERLEHPVSFQRLFCEVGRCFIKEFQRNAKMKKYSNS